MPRKTNLRKRLNQKHICLKGNHSDESSVQLKFRIVIEAGLPSYSTLPRCHRAKAHPTRSVFRKEVLLFEGCMQTGKKCFAKVMTGKQIPSGSKDRAKADRSVRFVVTGGIGLILRR